MKRMWRKCWLYLIGLCIALTVSNSMTVMAASADVSSVSFVMSDIRTLGSAEDFVGNNGKYAVIVFGGVGSCSLTNTAIEALDEIAEYADMSQLDVYIFDIKNNSAETIVAGLEEMDISNELWVNSKSNVSGVNSLYYSALEAAEISSSWTMPLVAYKNPVGELYTATNGSTNKADIIENLAAGGLVVEVPIVDYGITVDGTSKYDISYMIFDIVNQERAAAGLAPLEMDQDLLETAALRAAECSVFYSSGHLRPTGETCFTAHDKMSGENIAFIMSTAIESYSAQELAEWVMENWMNSTGHRANILREYFTTIGVGAFLSNDTVYFVQNFGANADVVPVTTPANAVQESFSFLANEDYTQVDMLSEIELEVGDAGFLDLVVTQSQYSYLQTPVNHDAYTWTSSNPACATVDQQGLINVVGEGRTTITATNIYNAAKQLQCVITTTNADVVNPDDSTGSGNDSSADTPSVDAPSTDTPSVDTPSTDTPSTGAPSGSLPGIPEVAVTVYNGVDYSDVYDLSYYRENNPDVASAFDGDAELMLKHFVEYGMAEGRQASAEFDINAYSENNADVAAAYGSDNKSYYMHYINYGKAEGRVATGNGGQSGNVNTGNVDYSPVFDATYYANANPDVAAAYNGDAQRMLQHFVEYGMAEGRIASAEFDINVYRENNPDVAAAYGADNVGYYMHYINYGKAEGRIASGNGNGNNGGNSGSGNTADLDYSLVFDATYYANANADIKTAYGSDGNLMLQHFVNYGMSEARRASANFDVRAYRVINADLEAAYGDDWVKYYRHYIEYGCGEGRRATY